MKLHTLMAACLAMLALIPFNVAIAQNPHGSANMKCQTTCQTKFNLNDYPLLHHRGWTDGQRVDHCVCLEHRHGRILYRR